jgi:signal transduction histidine kinase/CheY-like chemotaxis protein
MPIARKLALLVMTAVASATVAMGCVSVWQGLNDYAEIKTRTLMGAAQVFASATAHATATRDSGAAYQAMKAIAHIPDLSYARIDIEPGRTLAVLGSATQLDADLRIHGDGQKRIDPLDLLSTRTIEINVPIINAGVNVGRFILVADTKDLSDQLLSSLRGAALSASVAMAIGLLVAGRFHRELTRPLRELSQTIWSVRQGHEYGARVDATSNDEVGLLIDGFNTMLDEIRERDTKLAAHRRNLEQEVSDRTHDLRLAKNAAESANAAKSSFLATMSHEIRTPMNGVLVMAELLAAADIPQRQKRYAEVISKSGKSLLAIINDILDFSKIESGKLELEKIAVNPSELAEDAISLFGERAREKGLDLVSYVAPETPRGVTGDPVRINQVIGNLVNNALKFTQKGSVVLHVGPDPNNASRLRFAVTDTGIGIPGDKLADIFGAFTQADQSTTRRFGGTGLGLAISKRLIEAMGGEFEVSSAVGAGSTFAFSIPQGDFIASLPWPRVAKGGEHTAIVAVDGFATEKALTRYLAAAGYHVEIAAEVASYSAAIIFADPDRVPVTRQERRAKVVCLATLGDPSAYEMVRQGKADAVIARPLAHSEMLDLLTAIASGAPIGASVSAANERLEFPQFPSLRALVADDVAINREIAIEALGRLGASASTVENGLDAVTAATEQDFGIILMDVSMPEVDGFEATRRIRAMEQATGRRHTPIVAVTAHVIGSAADAWREAGMDAVLHKPFTIRALAECLAKFRPPVDSSRITDSSAINRQGVESAVEACEEPLLSVDALQQLLSFGHSGTGDFASRVLGLYIDHAPESTAQIIDAFAKFDIAAVGRAAHALKSMSLNIGAQRVAFMAADIERRADLGPSHVTGEMIANLSRALEATCAEVALQRASAQAAFQQMEVA